MHRFSCSIQWEVTIFHTKHPIAIDYTRCPVKYVLSKSTRITWVVFIKQSKRWLGMSIRFFIGPIHTQFESWLVSFGWQSNPFVIQMSDLSILWMQSSSWSCSKTMHPIQNTAKKACFEFDSLIRKSCTKIRHLNY